MDFFFTGKSFVKFFPTFKLEIEFHSHKKVVSPKLENSAHLFIVYFKCAKFQKNQRTFLREVGREVGREVDHNEDTVRVRLAWGLLSGTANLSYIKIPFTFTLGSF